MNEMSAAWLEKAGRAIHAGEAMVERGDIDFAAGRAYYAMFYVAKALLAERGLDSRRHAGVHALFGEHFAKPALMDPKFHRMLIDAFDRRVQGDYSFTAELTAEDATVTLAYAREFLAAAKKFLGVAE